MDNPFNLDRPAYSVRELLEILPLSRTTVYEEIKSGRLKPSKVGKRTIFLAPDIIAFLKSLSSSKAA